MKVFGFFFQKRRRLPRVGQSTRPCYPARMIAKSGKIQFANQLRGLAVVLVMIGHLVLLFWQAPELVSRSIPAPAPLHDIPWIT